MKNIKSEKYGLTTVELIFGIAFVSFIGLAATNFQKNMFSSGDYLINSLSSEGEARLVLRKLVSELRSMNYSEVGGYPIESATEYSLIFYSDTNGDGNTERLRYFVDDDSFKRGIVYPSGSPLSYNLSSEKVDILVRNIVSGSPVFRYYDTSYSGSEDALSFPLNLPLVRLIEIDIPISIKNRVGGIAYGVSSKVSIRNLKENL